MLSHETLFETPEKDQSVIDICDNGLWEVPHLAGKGIPIPDLSMMRIDLDPDQADLSVLPNIQTPYEALDLPLG